MNRIGFNEITIIFLLIIVLIFASYCYENFTNNDEINEKLMRLEQLKYIASANIEASQNYESQQFVDSQNHESQQFVDSQNHESQQYESQQNHESQQHESLQYESQQFESQHYESQQKQLEEDTIEASVEAGIVELLKSDLAVYKENRASLAVERKNLKESIDNAYIASIDNEIKMLEAAHQI